MQNLCDCTFVLKNSEDSSGTQGEITNAESRGMKVFHEKDGFPSPEDIF
jgi:hypothetical protein